MENEFASVPQVIKRDSMLYKKLFMIVIGVLCAIVAYASFGAVLGTAVAIVLIVIAVLTYINM